jgi:hypothetical protein
MIRIFIKMEDVIDSLSTNKSTLIVDGVKQLEQSDIYQVVLTKNGTVLSGSLEDNLG